MNARREVFISVDIETAGPVPSDYALLTIGACVVDEPAQTFACALKPTTRQADPAALKVSGLSLDELETHGLPPREGIRAFGEWIARVSGDSGDPVFVGLNAAFDWSFVNYYFHHYLGENPFGFSALDIKSLYMGAMKTDWHGTRSSRMAETLHPTLRGDHDALHDALYQAELFRAIRAQLN